MTLIESGNIKQSFGSSISRRGTLDQKLQPGNNNNIADNSQKMILITSKRLSRLNLVSN